MDFRLSAEESAFAESVRRFAREELAAGALQRAHDAKYPWETAQKIARQGLMGIAFPESEGGAGGTLMDSVIAIEEVALACPRSADIVQAGNFGPIRTFVEYASASQKARFLDDLLAGRSLISLERPLRRPPSPVRNASITSESSTVRSSIAHLSNNTSTRIR